MRRGLLLLWLGFRLASATAAQDETAPPTLQELEERLARLEAEREEERSSPGMGFTSGDVQATFQIFGDVGAQQVNPAEEGEGHTSFFLGSVDFFVNTSFGDHWRVLSETVVDGKSDDQISVSQERLWGAWVLEDSFYVKLGTEHSPVSRWNQLYHHGHWLETTIERPSLVAFEGDGGILPLHRTGVTIGGSQHTEVGRFEYFGTVSNGRGEQPTDKQRTEDVDDHKAIDVGLAFEPYGSSDWRFGVAATRDTIPEDPASIDPLRAKTMEEWIFAGHAQVRHGPMQVLGEVAYIAHEAAVSAEDFDSHAGYLQVEYRVEDWTPYTRFDYRDMAEGDPFYGPLGRDTDLWTVTLGVRRDVGSNVAIKLETAAGEADHVDGTGDIDQDGVVFVGFQLAWWL